MERKFTDDEIEKALKALERIADSTPPICNYEEGKTEPPFCKPFEDFQEELKLALDHINRQKAENERLQTVKKHIQNLILRDCDYPDPESYNNAFKKALERLHNNCNIKTEAIKEFAARANEKLQNLARIHMQHGSDDIYFLVSESFIDNVLKELTEEKK